MLCRVVFGVAGEVVDWAAAIRLAGLYAAHNPVTADAATGATTQ
jgi:hypothetical protein